MKTTEIPASKLSQGHRILINGKVKTVVKVDWTHVYLRSNENFAPTTWIPKNNDLINIILDPS